MIQNIETEVLAVLRDVLSADTRLTRRLARLQPTKQLARMLGGSGASLIETRSRSIGKPNEVSRLIVAGRSPGRKSHASKETPDMQRHLYPADWNERVQAADQRAGGRCERCGAVLGTMRLSRMHKLYLMPLHTSHVNHDPENPQAELQKPSLAARQTR